MGSFVHACEGEMVCESVNPKIPYFNAPIYLENKTAIGKVDEIMGPINQVCFTIKPQEGIEQQNQNVRVELPEGVPCVEEGEQIGGVAYAALQEAEGVLEGIEEVEVVLEEGEGEASALAVEVVEIK
ncbi:MAG: hypothetical protein Q9222_001105 [Ikaeria aurantiellina]